MKTIVIKTQEDMDVLPDAFSEYTVIEIRSCVTIAIKKARENSSVVARENSRVVAREESRVEAWEDSRVEARGNSRVEARGNSRVVAWENSSVEARGNSSVVARGNSSVEARGNSSVEARENSRVVARGNSRVEARGNSSVGARGNSRVVAREDSSVVARENSSVEAWEDSRVEAWEDSRVEARGNSRVEAFLCATVFVFSAYVTIKKLLDNAHLIYKKDNCKRPEQTDLTAKTTEFSELITPTFEQWLERGYVVADGITKNLVSQKTIGNVTIFEVTDFSGKENSFVAKIGNKFAHGKTIEEAKNDLRYKLSDRDTSKYDNWTQETEAPLDDMIECYMTITGACSFGTKEFCERNQLKDRYTVKEVIDLTVGSYGNKEFKEHFKRNNQ
jgi:hypothetical protein